MRRLVLLIFCGLLPLAAAAQGVRGFDATALPDQDARFLQAALVWSGDYAGLTDGDWGARSRAALAAFVGRRGGDPSAPREADLRALLEPFAREVAANGWTVLNLDGITVMVPVARLGPAREEEFTIEYRSRDGGLVFRVLFDGMAATADMHDWMVTAHAGPEEPYYSWRDDRLISAVTLANGRRVYLRSFILDGWSISMQVIAMPAERRRLELIASSMQWGSAPELAPRRGGVLDRILFPPPPPAPRQLPPPPVAAPAPAPAPGPGAAPLPGRLIGMGTGFFVNATDIVTAEHVIEGCGRLRLEDGTPLSVLAADPVLDLAVLASGRRSARWLPIRPDLVPRLGQPAYALGYPYRDLAVMADQGVVITGGNISALPRVADATSRIMLSAPVQPGNSGGPLLARDGLVLGVVVARLAEDYVLDRTGTLPQNMNYATSVERLVPFLEAAGVALPAAPKQTRWNLSDALPEAVAEAVVLIVCHAD
ncbi:S1 family peptidase [Rubellimicrobium thermophilum]|nr:serine protease [Rubellimicrobium thermophilum]